MATTEDEDFWGHPVGKPVDDRTSLRGPPTTTLAESDIIAVDKTKHVIKEITEAAIENVSSRKTSAKTLKSVKSVKRATFEGSSPNRDTVEIARDSDIVSIKKRLESAESKRKTSLVVDENDIGEVENNVATRLPSAEPEIERNSRTPSPVSDGPGPENLHDSRASLISDAEDYYKDDEFEADDHLDSQLFKEEAIFSDVDEPTAVLEQSTASKFDEKTSDAEVVVAPVAVDEPKKKGKKKKKDDKKKKEEKKGGAHGILGMLSAPTMLAGAIVQAPAESMKGKLKKKIVPATSSTTIAAASVKTPIKKKISAFVEPRTSKSSRSRASLDEISFLRKQLEQTTKENRTLKQIQRRQDAALARLEGTNSDMPNLANRYAEEIRILKEQLRMQKEKFRERDRILKERSMQMEKLREKAKKYEKMLNDKNILRRKRAAVGGGVVAADDKDVQKLEEMLEDKEKKIKDLERQSELLSKNFKHQFNIEVLRHKETQRKLTEYSAEYQRLTGRELVSTNNNNNAYLSQRSPRRTTNAAVEPSPRRPIEQNETKNNRSNTADLSTNGFDRQTTIRHNSKPRKINHIQQSKVSPQRSTNRTNKMDANSNKKSSGVDDERSLSPKLTLFADYQRSLTSTPKKMDAHAITSSYASERLSSPLNDDLIRSSSRASRKSVVAAVEPVQKNSLGQIDAHDSLLDFTKRPLIDSSPIKPLIADDPFSELKKSSPLSSNVRPTPTDFIAQNGSKTKSSSDRQRSNRNSADSGLASAEGSPNAEQQQQENKIKSQTRKNIFDVNDDDLFPMAKAKNGPKMANGLFPWEQEALMKTKS